MNLVGSLRAGRFLGLEVGSLKPLLFLALILIAVLLRAGNLGEFRNIEADESFWLGIGVSLIQSGVPTAWTIFGGEYQAAGIVVGAGVTPNLDHPPLFSLIVGAWAYLIGQSDMAALDWSLVRIPMIVISIVTIIVTYLFVRRVFGGKMATFTLLAYVFFPSHIVASRSIAAEHLIGLLLMLGLYLFAVFETTEKKKVRNFTGGVMVLLCVASLMIKLSAVIIPATLIFLAFYRRRFRLGGGLVFGAILSVLLLLTYGYYYNWDLFYALLVAHQARPQSLAHFWTLFTHLDIGHYVLYDPSVVVGLVGVIVLAAKYHLKRGPYILTPLLVISFLFLWMAPDAFYGWYKFVVYPLMAIGLGFVFDQLYEQRAIYLVLFLPLLSLMLQHSGVLDEQTDRRIAVVLFYVLATLPMLFRNRWLQLKPVFLSLLLFLFIFEAVWVHTILYG